MPSEFLFEYSVAGLTIKVYRGNGLLASIVRDGVEYPPETQLELDYEGRLLDTSKALLTRVLQNDLKLDPSVINQVEASFYSSELAEKLREKSGSIKLRHINDIEDPGLANKLVEVSALITSGSTVMTVPTKVLATSENSRDEKDFYAGATTLPLEVAGVGKGRRLGVYKRNFPTLKGAKFEEEDYRALYMVNVRAPIFSLELDDAGRLIDDVGREYKAHELYLISDKSADFPPSTLIRATGWVIPHPRTSRPVVVADRWDFPEKIEAYDLVKLRQLKSKLDGFPSIDAKVGWILTEFEKFSGIVRRGNVALANLLGYFTPLWLKFDNDVQRGWGLIFVVGDTTTAKSETSRKLLKLLRAGTYITAETASQVGLTGAAVPTENQGWIIDWGFIVLEDRRLLIVDGAQKLSSGNWAALAEAERSGKVSITKAAKAQAPSRTRQIKIANPRDVESPRYGTKAMREFLHSVQALSTVLDRTSVARQDLAVFVRSEDVKAEEVNAVNAQVYDQDLGLLTDALKWAWSGGAEVRFDSEAAKEILLQATRLYKKFHVEEIPLVSIDMKWKLARMSAALAAMVLSTTDFTSVEVKKEHVEYLVTFIEAEYTQAGLHALAEEESHEVLVQEEATRLISEVAFEVFSEYDSDTRQKVLADRAAVEGTVLRIIKFVVQQGHVTAEQLKNRFELTEKKTLRPLIATLTSLGLMKRGNGFYPTAKAIQLVKLMGSPGLPALPGSETNS